MWRLIANQSCSSERPCEPQEANVRYSLRVQLPFSPQAISRLTAGCTLGHSSSPATITHFTLPLCRLRINLRVGRPYTRPREVNHSFPKIHCKMLRLNSGHLTLVVLARHMKCEFWLWADQFRLNPHEGRTPIPQYCRWHWLLIVKFMQAFKSVGKQVCISTNF